MARLVYRQNSANDVKMTSPATSDRDFSLDFLCSSNMIKTNSASFNSLPKENCTNNSTNATTKMSAIASNSGGFATLKVQNSNMDNRSLDNLNNAKGLTPVESHPLMMQLSPTGSANSSDSIEYAPVSGATHAFMYPDLVPDNEKNSTHDEGNANVLSDDDSDVVVTSRNVMRNGAKAKLKPTSLSLDLVKNDQKLKSTAASVRKKIQILQEPAYSSGSDQDLSQYQATVGPTFETVTLVSHAPSKAVTMAMLGGEEPTQQQQRRISVDENLVNDDLSSPETPNGRLSVSPSSSIFEDGIIPPEDTAGGDNTPGRDRSNWVKVTLPDGKTREIDMKVIEPYKRILSHGGYINKKNAIIVFSTCFLPDRSRSDYHYVMANLFLYVIKTLQQLITDDYVLIYFHGGSNKNNVPPFRWLKKCYQLIDRRLRKSLKAMYLVHPSFWLKSMVWMLRPFVSTKFWRKLVYVRSLNELYGFVNVERAAVPDKVRNYDLKHS